MLVGCLVQLRFASRSNQSNSSRRKRRWRSNQNTRRWKRRRRRWRRPNYVDKHLLAPVMEKEGKGGEGDQNTRKWKKRREVGIEGKGIWSI